jgi:hypothetical protein
MKIRNKCIQDKHPNFRDKSGKLFLVRCFNCEPERGRENWAPAVATGSCAWCGWTSQPLKKTT